MKLIVFYLSCFLAFIAGHMLNYSAIMYSLAQFDSSLLAGVAYGFCFGPPIIFGWLAGAYIDRYSAKKVLLLAQSFFVLGALGMFVVMKFTLQWPIVLFLLSSFSVGIAWGFVAPSRLASLGQYVELDKLPQATITYNLLVMIGFGIAPILLTQLMEMFDWHGVALTSLAMFIVSSLLLINAPNQHTRTSHNHLLHEWQECFAEIKQIPVIAQLLFAAIIGYLLMGPMQVILPQVAEGQLGLNNIEKGQYLGLIAVSLILGGVAAMKIKNRFPIGPVIIAMLFMCGIGLGLIGYISTVWISCVVLVISTTMAGIVVSLIMAGLQHHTPSPIRGRVMSIYTIISQVISAMAGVAAGAIAQGVDVPTSLYVIAALFIVLSIWLGLKGRALKRFAQF
jgi:MFS family permease